jgi:hypothetical protein
VVVVVDLVGAPHWTLRQMPTSALRVLGEAAEVGPGHPTGPRANPIKVTVASPLKAGLAKRARDFGPLGTNSS